MLESDVTTEDMSKAIVMAQHRSKVIRYHGGQKVLNWSGLEAREIMKLEKNSCCMKLINNSSWKVLATRSYDCNSAVRCQESLASAVCTCNS
jgi:hypothetical protein